MKKNTLNSLAIKNENCIVSLVPERSDERLNELSDNEFDMYIHLDNFGPKSFADICRVSKFSKKTVLTILEGLKAKDFVVIKCDSLVANNMNI